MELGKSFFLPLGLPGNPSHCLKGTNLASLNELKNRSTLKIKIKGWVEKEKEACRKWMTEISVLSKCPHFHMKG